MSNVAPEHGETPFGESRTGPGLGTGGGRPPVPAEPIGTVSPDGPSSASPFNDPADPDRDMDED